jgi:hypothetical protein
MAASRLGLPSYSSIDHASTVRPCATSLLTINSDDRFKDYAVATASSDADTYNISPYSFTINRAESLLPTPPTRLAITEVAFQWAIPNITPNTNRIFVYYGTPPGPLYGNLITIPVGFYTPSELADILQAKIRANVPALGSCEITYGTDLSGAARPIFTYKSNSFSTLMCFSPITQAESPDILPTFKQLFNVLGFNRTNSPDGFVSNIGYGGLTFAQTINYVDIVCTQLTALQGIRDTSSQSIRRDALARLYIVNPSDVSNVSCADPAFCPPGCAPFTIYKDYATPKQAQWIPNQPVGGSLKFEVYADDGLPLSEYDSLPFANYTNWSITILLSEN